MSLEIERRFLVKGEEWKKIAGNAQHLRQGYLISSITGWTVRVRIMEEEKAWLTLKTQADGIAKYEFEYLIPLHDAEAMWQLAPHKLTKTRYPLNLNEGEWIVDCFQANNSPLVIAEVELTSADQKIQEPKWCLKEITQNKQLSNAALAQKPISNWSRKNLMTIKVN